MSHGGKRSGAGRKIGAVSEATKRKQEITVRALAEGKSPLEVMLDNMRHFQQVALDAEAVLAGLTVEEIGGADMSPEEQFKMLLAKAKNAAGFRQMAQECARDAASYVHPRLSSVESKTEHVVRYVADVPEVAGTTEEWQRQHVNQTIQ